MDAIFITHYYKLHCNIHMQDLFIFLIVFLTGRHIGKCIQGIKVDYGTWTF